MATFARTAMLTACIFAALAPCGGLDVVTSKVTKVTKVTEKAEQEQTDGGPGDWAMWSKVASGKGACIREPPARQNILFGAHHKTGTVLMEQVRKCIAKTHPEMNVTVDEHLQGKHSIYNFTKVVHWVRNPFSLIVSSYLYHRDEGEGWGREKGSAASILKHLHMAEGEVETVPEESYKELLGRIPVEVGLHTELRRFLKPLTMGVGSLTGREALEISSAHHRCAGHYHKCMEVCLEPFLDSSTSYMASWKTVMDFIGLCLDDGQEEALKSCLEQADINSMRFSGFFRHITRHSLTQQSRQELMRIVQELDFTLHDGATKSLEESLGCF